MCLISKYFNSILQEENNRYRFLLERISNLHKHLARTYFTINIVYPVIEKNNLNYGMEDSRENKKMEILKEKIEATEAAELVSKNLLSTFKGYRQNYLIKYANLTNKINRIKLFINSNTFYLGEDIIITIKVYDHNDHHIPQGGAILQLWMEEESHNARVSGYVIDHGNGSYTGHVRTMWRGYPKLVVSMVTTAEEIGLYLDTTESVEYLGFNFATFSSNGVQEVTMCTNQITRFHGNDFCNFTKRFHENNTMYCVKPSELNCNNVVTEYDIRNMTTSTSGKTKR